MKARLKLTPFRDFSKDRVSVVRDYGVFVTQPVVVHRLADEIGVQLRLLERCEAVLAARHGPISGTYASVSGGYQNDAGSDYASVSGGYTNDASGDYASVSGGIGNTAGGDWASVSGGHYRSVAGNYDWRAGTLFEEQ